MKKYPYIFIFTFLISCTSATSPPADNAMAEDAPLAVSWGVLSNIDSPDTFTSELVITNTSKDTLPNQGWSLYFNFIRLIQSHSNMDQAQITHINGDFYRLNPEVSIAPGEKLSLTLHAHAWTIKNTDAPEGFYMVDQRGDEEKILQVSELTIMPFTDTRQTSRLASDKLPVPTPESTFEKNQRVTELPIEEIPPILPSPTLAVYSGDTFSLSSQTPVYFDEGLDAQATFLSQALSSVVEGAFQPQPLSASNTSGIILRSSGIESNNNEAYELSISPDRVEINGSSASGVFYGIQTLRALIQPEHYSTPATSLVIPTAEIQDHPRFSYRGMHLDVSRNFQTVETVKKLLDAMAFYKLNKFHFHLTDDEGWRLEIPGLPELTSVGSRRGHTLDEQDRLFPSLGSGPFVDELPGSGYYTREEYIDILLYAKSRHIEVIPEIDVPGHARAAIVAMKARYHTFNSLGQMEEANTYLLSHPDDQSTYRSVQHWNDNVIDVCLPSTYAFRGKVFDELRLMHEEASTPLTVLHTGGDEVPHGVWEGSPACDDVDTNNLHDYFLENVYQLLNKHNIRVAGWEEIAMTDSSGSPKAPNSTFIPYRFQPYVWNNVWGWGMEDMAYKLANAGYPVVLSNATNLYFDLSYDKSPEEPGYYWASFVDTYKAFSFTPLDLFKSAETDIFGNQIDRQSSYPNRVTLTETGRNNILGVQGQLWSERAYDAEAMEYLIFPKMLGLAERAWASQPTWATIEDDAIRSAQRSQAWNQFANQLGQRELPRLDGFSGGFSYRIPPPGARIVQGTLYANTDFPGLQIRYTTDGREPTVDDPLFTEPVAVTPPVKLRTFASSGRSSRSITLQ